MLFPDELSWNVCSLVICQYLQEKFKEQFAWRIFDLTLTISTSCGLLYIVKDSVCSNNTAKMQDKSLSTSVITFVLHVKNVSTSLSGYSPADLSVTFSKSVSLTVSLNVLEVVHWIIIYDQCKAVQSSVLLWSRTEQWDRLYKNFN